MSAGASRQIRMLISTRQLLALGLLGALAFMGGAGLYLAMINPPYQQDESSHVGYTLALQQATLPAIDTPVPTNNVSPELTLALRRPYPFSDPEIHVANNPPHAYLVAIPFVKASVWAGVRGGEVFGFRLFDLAGAVAAVGISFLLGRELAGGDGFAGLVCAGLVSSSLSIALVTSLANSDGPALAATTGVTWALARFARTKAPAHALHLGLWCAAAAAVRPMSLAFAAVAGFLALAVHLRAHGLRAVGAMLARLAGPTAVITGWFYALNIYRYGDLTGSQGLFEKYGTASGPSLFSNLFSTAPFVQTLDYLLTDVYGRDPWWGPTGPDKWAVTFGALAVTVTALAMARRSDRPEVVATGRPRLCQMSWLAVTVLAAVPMFLIAQHMSGGGAGHARYLMPILPILAAAAAVVATRLQRWVGVAAVVLMVGFQFQRIRAAGHLRYGPGPTLFAPELNTPIMGSGPRTLAIMMMLVGAMSLVGVLAVSAAGVTDRRRRRS